MELGARTADPEMACLGKLASGPIVVDTSMSEAHATRTAASAEGRCKEVPASLHERSPIDANDSHTRTMAPRTMAPPHHRGASGGRRQ
jgi:hypothetical protein